MGINNLCVCIGTCLYLSHTQYMHRVHTHILSKQQDKQTIMKVWLMKSILTVTAALAMCDCHGNMSATKAFFLPCLCLCFLYVMSLSFISLSLLLSSPEIEGRECGEEDEGESMFLISFLSLSISCCLSLRLICVYLGEVLLYVPS